MSNSLEIYAINSLINKKKFDTNFIMSKVLFGVSQLKKKTKNTIINIKESSRSRKPCFQFCDNFFLFLKMLSIWKFGDEK